METTIVCGCQLAAVVMNLTPFTYYSCYVTATTSAGEGNPSSTKSTQTDESGLCHFYWESCMFLLHILVKKEIVVIQTV